MSRHFYGFDNTYGVGTTNSEYERIGQLHVFDSKKERDDWENEESGLGNFHRESLTSEEARHEMCRDYYVRQHFADEGWESISDVPTSQIVDFWIGHHEN